MPTFPAGYSVTRYELLPASGTEDPANTLRKPCKTGQKESENTPLKDGSSHRKHQIAYSK
ncbi:hypothetical protein [Chryseobacterium koreense]